MSTFAALAPCLAIGFLAIQVITCAICAWRCRRASPCCAPVDAPPITLVRPLCGLETYTAETLEASFRIDYPQFELIFCVAKADDPVIPLVQRAIRAYPQVSARLLVGDDPISSNPKLNNMAKGWRGANYDRIVFADSNLLVPRDYLSRLARMWDDGTGLVSAPPIGSPADKFWSELECAFLNSYEARWQYVVDAFGFGFAQGKTLFYRRSLIRAGVEALACEPAEDAATTKIIRALGLRVKLARPPFLQPLGERSFAEVWSRQIRWARLRRATFPLLFAPEVLTGILPALGFAAVALWLLSWPMWLLPIYAAVWYAVELLLVFACGWPTTWRSPAALVLRDLLIPALWAQALMGKGFVWKGHALEATQARRAQQRPSPLLDLQFGSWRPRSRRESEAMRPNRSAYAVLVARLPPDGRDGS
jgi:ceramide glucosyltransferase